MRKNNYRCSLFLEFFSMLEMFKVFCVRREKTVSRPQEMPTACPKQSTWPFLLLMTFLRTIYNQESITKASNALWACVQKTEHLLGILGAHGLPQRTSCASAFLKAWTFAGDFLNGMRPYRKKRAYFSKHGWWDLNISSFFPFLLLKINYFLIWYILIIISPSSTPPSCSQPSLYSKSIPFLSLIRK